MRAENRHVHVAAADHGEGVNGREVSHARNGLEELAAGVDEVDVLASLIGQGAAVQHAAFAVVEDDAFIVHEHGYQRWYADAEVYAGTGRQFLRHAHGDDGPVEAFFVCGHG